MKVPDPEPLEEDDQALPAPLGNLVESQVHGAIAALEGTAPLDVLGTSLSEKGRQAGLMVALVVAIGALMACLLQSC